MVVLPMGVCSVFTKLMKLIMKVRFLMSRKKNIWITPQKNGWAVKREGSTRSSKVTKTKKEAEKFGRHLGKKDGVEVITQRKDGTIQSKDSFGNDPNPPKDTEH